MDRIAVTAILIVLLGIWVSPFITGANKPAAAHDAAYTLHRDDNDPANSHAAATALTQLHASDSPASFDKQTQIAPITFAELHGQPNFWRLGKTATGAWWFVSPENKPEFLNTVTTVQPYQNSRDKDGPRFISKDWAGNPASATDDSTRLNDWAARTVARLKDIGFKGVGAWSNPILHQFDIPMTQDLNVSAWQKGESRRLYTPQWTLTTDLAIRTQTAPLVQNHNLVGYFIDNELDWGDAGAGPLLYFNDLPAKDPNRQQVLTVIQSVWTTIDGFNADWHTSIKDWKEIDGWTELPQNQPKAYGRLFSAWLSHLASDYFRTTTELLRKYDPNHLILGVRFKGYAPLEVVRASRGYTDAQSLNYYVGDARLDLEMFKMMSEESGQPVMISEYSFHSLDGRSGNRNTVGFAAQVLDQQARADGYRLLTSRLARVPYVIGADWFQWSDEPPGGRAGDGEDVNFGMVDVDDHDYEMLTQAVRDTAPTLDALHAQSVTDLQKDVWRESFTQTPTMNVPYLSKPITLNGELSDWPADAKLSEIRHSQTVGLERSKLPVPNVYLGWTEEGLYLGFEVFDDDIQGAPSKGWWWTRDNVEFWVSTRAVTRDQNNYDVFDKQFFFVPNDFPGDDGLAGVVGEWHRPGDGLKDNLIPQTDIREAVRVLPDRYVVEMLLPAKTLNGWDPKHNPTMAFNIHAHNWQHALDYYWSAPKEVMTQLRPSTWGTLKLMPPKTPSFAIAK